MGAGVYAGIASYVTSHNNNQHNMTEPVILPCMKRKELVSAFTQKLYSPPGGWATPSGTAILGQPVGQVKQASVLVPLDKNWSNVRDTWPHTRHYARKNSFFLLDLSQEAEKR